MTIYHMIDWFFAFSFIGYLIECTVLSFENRKPVLNRGFGHGPFCIIYGFGAVFACVILAPIADNPVKLYFASSLLATTMELVTARVMIHFFGQFWWNYSKKPFNYKGIICLESSIGWGFLGLFFFAVLRNLVHNLVYMVPQKVEKYLAISLVLFYMLDFAYCFYNRLNGEEEEAEEGKEVIGRMKVN